MRSVRWAISGLALLLSPSLGATPSVTLSAPVDDARYVAPATVTLVANPDVDAGRRIARVEFLADGHIVGSKTKAPYTVTLNNLSRGDYTLRARVTDNRGRQDLSPAVRVHVRHNTAPKVHVSAPEHRYLAPGTVPLTARVTDRDAPIAKVEFFSGHKRLATLTSEPYTFSWTDLAVGDYEVRAKATDALGAVGTSNTFHIRVRDNVAPRVRILAPADSATYAAPASVPIKLRAGDRDDNLGSVELFANGVSIAAFSAPPYEFNWTGVPPGTYALTAKATDELGLVVTSSVVTVTVTGSLPNVPPTVSLTSPPNNASFRAPANISLVAAAADADGTISKVEFFYGSTLVATRTEAPYSFIWTGVPEGAYELTAVVTDNSGASISSSVVNVAVSSAELKMYFVHVDHLNTPRLIENDQRQAVWRWEQQEPFGNSMPEQDPSGLNTFDFPFRFPGQIQDAETGLSYNYSRNYDPSIGRYGESDPIGLKGGLNTYAYAAATPLLAVDPDGLEVVFYCRFLGTGLGRWASRLFYDGRTQKHCFVHVTCPKEGIDAVLSLFGEPGKPLPSRGRKAMNARQDDNPDDDNTDRHRIVPLNDSCRQCCTYEKEVLSRFNSFPSGWVPYEATGWNSNSFAEMLVTSPTCSAQLPYEFIYDTPGLGMPMPR